MDVSESGFALNIDQILQNVSHKYYFQLKIHALSHIIWRLFEA